MCPDHLAIGIRFLELEAADYFLADMMGERNGQIIMTSWFTKAPELNAQPSDLQRAKGL